MSFSTLQLCRVVYVYDAVDGRHSPAIAMTTAAAAAAAAPLRCNTPPLIYGLHLS